MRVPLTNTMVCSTAAVDTDTVIVAMNIEARTNKTLIERSPNRFEQPLVDIER